MKVVHKNEGTDLLSVVPKAPIYFDTSTKKHWKRVARVLITANLLKRIHLDALGLLAQNLAQHEYAIRAIQKKNKLELGTGYIQTFKNNTSNISPEVTLKEKAEKAIFQCLKGYAGSYSTHV